MRWLIPLCFDAWLADASRSAASRVWSICFMRFRMRCNLKTAPNIREVSFVSVCGPLFEWKSRRSPMASRRSQAPQTSGPYALCHRPPLTFAPNLPHDPEHRRMAVCGLTCCYVLHRLNPSPLSLSSGPRAVKAVPFLVIGKLGGRLDCHQLEGSPMSTRTATTF